MLRRISLIVASLLIAPAFAETPSVYLWAWDRPEDLRFVEPHIGIAYFAGEIDLGAKKPEFRPRQKPLLVSKGQPVLPVLHVRARRGGHYGNVEQQLILDAIRRLMAESSTEKIQLDFEVYHSQRNFYKNLVRTIKEKNPHRKLSVTALASWCGHDSWLVGLPVAEIVPMLFDPSHKKGDANHQLPQASLCKESVGLANYETYATLPRAKIYYLFSNRAWRREDVIRMLARIHENSR